MFCSMQHPWSGLPLRATCCPFSYGGLIGGHISFSDLGTKDQDGRGFRFSPVFSYLIGFTFLFGILRYHGEGASALAPHSLTDVLGEWRHGAQLILLAIGIKAASGLHVWLKDGYAEATHNSTPVWLCAFTYKNVPFACWPGCFQELKYRSP